MFVNNWFPSIILPLVISTEALVALMIIHRNGNMDRKDAMHKNTYFARHLKLDCCENDNHQENRIGNRRCVSEVGRVFKAEIVDVL